VLGAADHAALPSFTLGFSHPAARLAADCINATNCSSAKKSLFYLSAFVLLSPPSKHIYIDKFHLENALTYRLSLPARLLI